MEMGIKTEWCMEPLHLKIVIRKIEVILMNQLILMIWLQALKRIRMRVNPLNKIETIITEPQAPWLQL